MISLKTGMLPGLPGSVPFAPDLAVVVAVPHGEAASAAEALVGERLLLRRQGAVEVPGHHSELLQVLLLLFRELGLALDALRSGWARIPGCAVLHRVVQCLHLARMLLDLLGIGAPRGFLRRGDLQVRLEPCEPLVGRCDGIAMASSIAGCALRLPGDGHGAERQRGCQSDCDVSPALHVLSPSMLSKATAHYSIRAPAGRRTFVSARCTAHG